MIDYLYRYVHYTYMYSNVYLYCTSLNGLDTLCIPVHITFFQSVTPPEHTLTPIRIHRGHVTTPQCHNRNDPQHVVNVLQCGDLIISAMTATTHNPGDEGSSGHRRSEYNGGESSTICESVDTDLYKGVRK